MAYSYKSSAWRRCRAKVRARAEARHLSLASIRKLHEASDQLGEEWFAVDRREPDKRWVLIYQLSGDAELKRAEQQAEQHADIEVLKIPYCGPLTKTSISHYFRITWTGTVRHPMRFGNKNIYAFQKGC